MAKAIRWSDEQLAAYQAQKKASTPKPSLVDQLDTASKRITGRGNKYGAVKTQIDGITFDSKAEGARYCELKRQQEAGLIAGLECHPRFKLIVNGELVATYEADFRYVRDTGERVVEDVKGHRTREYVMKRKLMKACHHIDIQEIKVERRSGKK